MHDFIQLQSFSAARPPVAPRPAVPQWIQCGLMRSFGEDDLPAYRPSPRQTGRSNPKSKIRNRK